MVPMLITLLASAFVYVLSILTLMETHQQKDVYRFAHRVLIYMLTHSLKLVYSDALMEHMHRMIQGDAYLNARNIK